MRVNNIIVLLLPENTTAPYGHGRERQHRNDGGRLKALSTDYGLTIHTDAFNGFRARKALKMTGNVIDMVTLADKLAGKVGRGNASSTPEWRVFVVDHEDLHRRVLTRGGISGTR